MNKQDKTLAKLKKQVADLTKFWCEVSVELDRIDLADKKTVERFGEYLDPHIDGWGYIQGPYLIGAPSAWLEDLLNDWPDFCQACREEISECKCEVKNE